MLFIVTSGQRLHAFDFASLFEGVDFDQLAKDLEPMLEEMEKQSQEQALGTQEEARADDLQQDLKMKQTPEAVDQTETDSKTLFLEPIKIEATDGQKGKYKFSQAKLNSYDVYMGSLVELLKTLEKKIDASQTLSPEFKALCTHYKTTIDDIVVSDAIISEKKLYQRVFFLSNFNELRKKIVGVIETLESLDKRITATSADEEKISDDVQKRAQESGETSDTILTPLELPKPVQRGKKSDKNTITKDKDLVQLRKRSFTPKKNQQLEADFKVLFEKDIKYIAQTLASARASKEAVSEIQRKKRKRDQEIQATRQRMAQRPYGSGYGSGYQRPYRSGSSSSSPWGGETSSPWSGSGSGYSRNWGSSPSRWGGAPSPWENEYNPTKHEDEKLSDKQGETTDTHDKDKKSKKVKLDKSELKAKKKAEHHLDAMIALMKKTSPTDIAMNLEAIADHIDGMNKNMIELNDKTKTELKNKARGAFDVYYHHLIDTLPSLAASSQPKNYQSSLSKIYSAISESLESNLIQKRAEAMAQKYADEHMKKLPAKKEDALKQKSDLEKIQEQAQILQALLPGQKSVSLTAFIEKIAELLKQEVATKKPARKKAEKDKTFDDEDAEDEDEDQTDDNNELRPRRRPRGGQRELEQLKRGLESTRRAIIDKDFGYYVQDIETARNSEIPNEAKDRLLRLKRSVKNLKQQAQIALHNASVAESTRQFNMFVEQAEQFKNQAQTDTYDALNALGAAR